MADPVEDWQPAVFAREDRAHPSLAGAGEAFDYAAHGADGETGYYAFARCSLLGGFDGDGAV
jgi:hypothetical protein